MARNMAVSVARRMFCALLKNPVEVRCMYYSGGSGWGSGSGKGGGTGGSIRDAGGAFGKKEAAQEEEYFRRQQAEQLAALKEHIKTEIDHHEEQVKRHQEIVERHKKKLDEFQKGKK